MSNILSEVHPELVAEWSDKNLPLTPDRITYGSNKVVWWKGACGHEWQTSVKARSNGENCPICSGARVIEGINDLATLKPELADEWSSKNDPLKPTMVTTGSHIEIDGAKADTEFVRQIIHTLGLEKKLKNMPNNLSGGQQQRVAIARALATKPAIILADEPTGNLDSKTSMDVILLMQSISRQFHQTTIMITHNEEIAQMADRTIRIEDGKVVSGGVRYAR